MKGIIRLTLIAAALLSGISCINHATYIPPIADTVKTYFPITRYAKNQWDTYYGQPHSLYRIVTLDGKKDTTLVNFLTMDWGAILKTFLESDISDTNFIGHYRYSEFDDTYTGNRYWVYEAKDPNLFTRQLQITIDPTTSGKILAIYIETFKKEKLRERHQRLLYQPMKLIQIQEDTHSTFGGARSLQVEYRFL